MKSKAALAIIISVIAVLAVVGVVMLNQEDEAPATNNESSQNQAPRESSVNSSGNSSTENSATQQPTSQTFTAAQVAEHSTKTDCWTIIDGSVYNITSYVPRHPGGDDILRACGKDGTSLCSEGKTEDGQEVRSSGHSSTAKRQLESLKIGTLQN